MKLILPEEKNWEEKVGYSKKVYLTPVETGQPGLQIQVIKLKPGQVAKEHFHKVLTEIFYFSKINGYFAVNGEKIELKEESILIVEPNDRHKVVNDSQEDFTYLVIKLNNDNDDFYFTDKPG
jgi:quercetin dioxygenase-like cupin family protein